jgi:hypothetical protein
MEITRALPAGSNVHSKTGQSAHALPKPLTFARSMAPPAIAKDGSLQHRVGDVYRGCEELGLQPGQQTSITVAGQSMILRRTQSADAYVLQTPDDAVNAPFNGLHLSNQSIAKLNMEPIEAGNPNYMIGLRQIMALSHALNVKPSDMHGFTVWK